MPFVQQASGTWVGTSVTPTLPAASSAANCVVVVIAGNTTVTTPANWTLRTSQVNFMGHYLYDRQGVSVTSVSLTTVAGDGTWWMAEIAGGAYQNALSANASAHSNTYTSPSITPTAGTRLVWVSMGSATNQSVVRTMTSFNSSFVEQVDLCQPTADYPMQAVGSLADFVANGSSSYSTTGTWSTSSNNAGRTAIIASYVTTAAGGPTQMPDIVMSQRAWT